MMEGKKGRRKSSEVLLGVLTATGEGDPRRLGAQTVSFAGLARVGRREGVRVVVFKPEGVRYSTRHLWGYVHDPYSGRWRLTASGWPDVVYNRVPSRSIERRPDVQRLIRRFQGYGIPLFNAGFLDKWTVYQALMANKSTAAHLPEVRKIESLEDVRHAMFRWGAFFLKPVSGSLGKGIIYLRRRPGRYEFHAFADGTYRRGWRRDWLAIEDLLLRLMRRRTYLAQLAIQRPLYRGRPYDIRALTQKDPQGVWRLSGAAARIASPGRVLTHVPRGGERCRVLEAVEHSLEGKPGVPPSSEILARLAAVATKASQAVDEYCPGLYAELSVDLTLDRRGNVWVLECNAKPSRFDEGGIRQRHLRRLIAFARATVDQGVPDSSRADVLEDSSVALRGDR